MAATMLTMSAQLAVVSPLSQVSFGLSTPTSSVRVATRSSRGRMVSMAAAPKGSSGPAIDKTGDKVVDKTEEAQEICAGDEQSEECATAWDAVESASAEKAKTGPSDPLEEFCEENPEADECRIYKD